MISWLQIIDVGHTAVMIPAAGAIAAYLLCAKAWKLAFWWCAIFIGGFSLVALSKIAFLGWGVEIEALRFQALSGHAWRSSAVLPVFFFLLLHRSSLRWRTGGAIFGAVLCAALGTLLVIYEFHTSSEVIVSYLLGIVASLIFIRVSLTAAPLCPKPWALPLGLFAFLFIGSLKPSLISHRLVDVALFVSGRDYPYQWKQRSEIQRPRKSDACQLHVPR